MMLHQWYRAKIAWGYAERGERCAACKKGMPINSRCLVLRLAHENDPDKFITQPIEVWCETCADLLWPRIYAGMEGMVRIDKAGEFGEVPVWQRWRFL